VADGYWKGKMRITGSGGWGWGGKIANKFLIKLLLFVQSTACTVF